jgi:hypothetical protein
MGLPSRGGRCDHRPPICADRCRFAAWRGETFHKIHAPGGAGVETPAAEVGSAAVGLAQYKEHVKERFEELDAAVAKLNRRLDELER